MSDIAIRTEHLGKQYRIGGRQARHQTFQEMLLSSLSAPVRWLKGERQTPQTFWALDDVSFEIKQGEAVGIIGRNGAGKSTLLKILSRITKPTKGRVDLYGRVASLLEVGTGFHSELSGRDNIYLNGAILGMTRREIDKKFDEIVDFSGVEEFIDTPVKRYSSGMYVRLAFAVAAHLEPEILVVDEVLAVGDVEFQKKCLGKMSTIAEGGRTVLFVSHNLLAIESLCRRVILMNKGSLIKDSQTSSVLLTYQNMVTESANVSLVNLTDRTGNGLIRFDRVHILDKDKLEIGQISSGQDLLLSFEYSSKENAPIKGNIIFKFSIADSYGRILSSCLTKASGQHFQQLPSKGKVVCKIPELPMLPGSYAIVDLWCKVNNQIVDRIDRVMGFNVVVGNFFGTGVLPPADSGPLLLHHSWELSND